MSESGTHGLGRHPDESEQMTFQRERRSLAQVQRFDELLQTAVRERAAGSAAEGFSGRLLSRLESAPEAMPERHKGPRLLWLSGVSGLAAMAVVAAFLLHNASTHSHDFQGSHVGVSAMSSPTFRVESQSRPSRQAKVSVAAIHTSPKAHAQSTPASIPQDEAPAFTRQEADLPRLETFPAREQTAAGGRKTEAAPDAVTAVAVEVVVVPAPAWETAELHIQPISVKALPSEKEPQ